MVGQRGLDLVYEESDTGRRISLREGVVQPLDLNTLLRQKGDLRSSVEFQLHIKNALIETSEIDDIRPQERRTVSAHLSSHYGSNVIALINGCWLPSGLVLNAETLLLPDRCTIGAIRARFLGGARKVGQGDDFLDFAANQPLKINPMLYAMEGCSGQAVPSETELSSLFDRAAEKILQALPKAIIFPDKAAVMSGAMGILNATAQSFVNRRRLLVKAAPLIASPIPVPRLRHVWDQLMDLSVRHGVPRNSLLMCTLLSATAAQQGANPALALLKPRRTYTDKHAFNALADLRGLDLLIGASTDFPERQVALLTEDRALAQLWAGLQIHSLQREGDHISYQLNPHEALFG